MELTTLRFLQTIDLSFNSIKFLPDSPGQLSRLVSLNLASNNIVNFPVDHLDVLASLLTLNVSNNHIDRFPTEFPYLYRLHVILAATNDLTELPKDIGLRMKGLVQLDVCDNMIVSIPESIVKCPNLKVTLCNVFFSECMLKTLCANASLQ